MINKVFPYFSCFPDAIEYFINDNFDKLVTALYLLLSNIRHNLVQYHTGTKLLDYGTDFLWFRRSACVLALSG